MIAIAGSKGGCGKSTVTLGLAEAFARADVPTVAVDADRQLPNLHVMTDLEREPTLAELEPGADVGELAQRHSRVPNVGIIPAPKPSRGFEFRSIREHLHCEEVQVLVDCPSGAGPDVVDPISQASGVIVVTSISDRNFEAAKLTIELASRLGVPLYGVLLNGCDSVPDAVTRWEDVPILGYVPERTDPLTDDEVAAAFDEVVDQLLTQSPIDRTPQPSVDGLLRTGIDRLDRRLGGGVPAGSVVALVADPASQAEHVLARATGVRGTLYLSTERSRATVRRTLEATSVRTGAPTIRRVDGDEALERASTLIGNLPEAATLIVDPVDELERRDRAPYVSFLDELGCRMDETNGLAILHCLEDESPNRAATLRYADVVLELEAVSPGVGSDVEHYLSVSKYRPDAGFSETIQLEFASGPRPGPIEPSPKPNGR